jgi:type IV pilus assembly protein PilA
MLKIFPQKQKGFTLVELLIIIAIIGILAAIAFPQFQRFRGKGLMATVRSDTKNAHTAVQAWIVDNPGGSAPAVQYTGPAVMTEYPPARVSPLVTIQITPTGEVTGSHDDLQGIYTIRADGAVADSLSY